MIKKSVFEDELIAGMQQELHVQYTEQTGSELVRAANCLRSAMEIFEEAGLQSKADALAHILVKIAEEVSRKSKPVSQMPAMHLLMEKGLTQKDLVEFAKGSPIAKAKINHILRGLGHSDQEIGSFIGQHNVVPAEEAADLAPRGGLDKIWDMIQNPKLTRPQELAPGDMIGMKSVLKDTVAQSADSADAKHKSKKDTAHPHKFQTPSTSKINDPHIKNLTPDKMIANLKHHGTVFNMSDDGADEHLLDTEVADELEVSDADSNLEMDFEDEI